MARILRDPQERFLALLAALDRRLRALERAHPEATSYEGPRSDDPHANGSNRGLRVRIGLLSDGTYGIERWTEAGVRQTPTWS